MIYSMTGFARKEQTFDWAKVVIEIRSVNHRFLDLSFKIPDEMRIFEMAFKEHVNQFLKRGKVEIAIRIFADKANIDKIAYDQDLVKKLSKTLHEVDRLLYNAAPAQALDVLSWPGVLIAEAGLGENAQTDLENLLDVTLEELQTVRAREGDALKQMIIMRLDEIKIIVGEVSQKIPEILQQQRIKIIQKLEDAKVRLDPERLEQEMVMIAQKMDVEEELSRILTHIIEVRHVLEPENNKTDVKGRRLDFLMQELNREANTLGSKSVSTITTGASVDLKVLIEQMREQIQNLE